MIKMKHCIAFLFILLIGIYGCKSNKNNHQSKPETTITLLSLTEGLHILSPQERNGMTITIDGEKIPAYNAKAKRLNTQEILQAFRDSTLSYDIYADKNLTPRLAIFKPISESITPQEDSLPPMEVSLEYAPNFTTKDLAGNTISLEKLKEKVVVMNFWFTHCQPCIEEIPELNTLVEKYKNKEDIVFIAITHDPAPRVIRFLDKHPFQYTIVTDAQDIMDSYIVLSYPTNIILDKKGNIVYHSSGYRHQIDKIMARYIDKAFEN